MSNRTLFLYSFLFYLLFVAIRLFGLFSFDIQPDEVHWLERSHKVLDLYKDGQFSKLTTHLGQPGIVPALVMACAQGVGEKVYAYFNIQPSDLYYIHPFYLCRLACMLVSSLIVFPLILLGTVFFEFRVMALACLFLAFSPHHIGFSRLAHLDGTMTVTVITSILFYLRALKTGVQRYKLYAGVFWGLSIATKPTALSLVFAFLLMGALSSFYVRKKGLRESISVYDLWAVLIGHVVFALIYTRIWVHESDYLNRLHIKNKFADLEYFIGTTYHYIGLCVFSLMLVYCIYKYRKTEIRGYLFPIFFSTLAVLSFMFPAVLEGIIRFWSWTLGLSKTSHVAYGKTWKAGKGGYFSLVMFETSLTILSLTILNLLHLVYSLLRGTFAAQDRKRFYLFLIFTLWVLVLSVSSKQTIRYILPVFPCLYVLASDSVWRLFDFATKKFSSFKSMGPAFCLLFLIPQFVAVASTHPNQVVFYNALGGGVDGLAKRGGVHYLIGINKLVTFLRQKSLDSGRASQLVYVGGELGVPKLAHSILFPRENETKFLAPAQLMWGSYFMRFHHLDEVFFETVPSGVDVNNPEYEVKLGQSVLVSLYKVNTPSLDTPFAINTVKLHRKAGRAKRIGPEFAKIDSNSGFEPKVFELLNGREKKGYAFFNSNIELEQGGYELGFYARLVQEESVRTPVFEIQFGKCKQVVYSDELETGSFKLANSSCVMAKKGFVSFKVYWFGKVGVEIGEGRLLRVGDGD